MGETLRRTLELLGFAEDDDGAPEETHLLIDALEQRVAENTAEIEELRAELARLRECG